MVYQRVHVAADELTRVVVSQQSRARGIGERAQPLQIDSVDRLRGGIQQQPDVLLAVVQRALRVLALNPQRDFLGRCADSFHSLRTERAARINRKHSRQPVFQHQGVCRTRGDARPLRPILVVDPGVVRYVIADMRPAFLHHGADPRQRNGANRFAIESGAGVRLELRVSYLIQCPDAGGSAFQVPCQRLGTPLQHFLRRVAPGQNGPHLGDQRCLSRPVGQRSLCLLPRVHLPLQIRRVRQQVGVQAAVLIDPAHLRRQDHREPLILLAELVQPHLVDEPDVPVDAGRRSDGNAQPGMDRRMPRGKPQRFRIDVRITQPRGPALPKDRLQNPGPRIRRSELRRRTGIHTTREQPPQPGARFVENSCDGIPRADDLPRRCSESLQQPLRIELRAKLEDQFDQRREPLVGGLQIVGLLRQLVRQQPQVLAVELLRVGNSGGRRRAQDPRHRGQDDFRLSRLDDHVGDSAGAS